MASFRHRFLMRFVNLYPPFLGAGIRVTYPKGDPHTIVVRLGLHWWNRNLFGTQFGGSLYAMCDPFFVFIVLRNLGPGYIVWDKAVRIEFLKPGRGLVTAECHLDGQQVERLRREAADGSKQLPEYTVEIRDAGGDLVARVRKRLYVRLKKRARPVAAAQAAED